MAYFLIKDISKGRTPRVTGEMIVPAQVAFEEEEETQSSSAPKPSKPKPKYYPKLPKIGELKWILPPKGSVFGDGSDAYRSSKAFAESMGYDTVEHDDFSYPGR